MRFRHPKPLVLAVALATAPAIFPLAGMALPVTGLTASAFDLDDDNDGILNQSDRDDDNDGIVDRQDFDDDNDGISDALDRDDDNEIGRAHV